MKKYFFLLIILGFTAASCQKEKGCTNPEAINYDSEAEEDDGSCEFETEEQSSNLFLRFNSKAGSNDLAYNETYEANGVKYQFTIAKTYISNIKLMGNSETEDQSFEEGLHFLVTPDSNEFELGDVPSGKYSKLKFGVGVDEAYNTEQGSRAKLASDYSTDHPLSASQNMYWSWKPGYVFMKMEGKVDSNGDGDFNDDNEVFSIHTGLDELYKNLERDIDQEVSGDNVYLTIDIDYQAYFNNLDITGSEGDQHPMHTDHPDYPESVKTMNNVESVFSEVSVQ